MVSRRVVKNLLALANLVLPLHSMPRIRLIGHAMPYPQSRHTGVAAAKRLAKKRRQAKKS